MTKQYFLFILVLTLIMIPLSASTIASLEDNDMNRSQLNVSAEQSFDLKKITDEIKSHKYYENHSNETLAWMESLHDKKIFTGRHYMVIMDSDEADKLPTELATDIIIYDEFEANIIENKSLGNGLKDVLYVKNVEFKKQGIISWDEYNPQDN